MTGTRIRFAKKKKPASGSALFSPQELIACEGRAYCQNYDAGNITCVRCAENREGPFRAGCFVRVEK